MLLVQICVVSGSVFRSPRNRYSLKTDSFPVERRAICYKRVNCIADTPKQSLLAGISPKASPVSTATYKEFGNPVPQPPRTSVRTLQDIKQACLVADPDDVESFLKIIKCYHLNGVHRPFWRNWPLSDPSILFMPEVLHVFHCMFWDHDLQW